MCIRDRLAVAQEVMPLPEDNDHFLMNDGESIYSTRHGYWNPGTNAEQWKALTEWCATKGLCVYKLGDEWTCCNGPTAYHNQYSSGESQIHAMQRGVLRYLQTQIPR